MTVSPGAASFPSPPAGHRLPRPHPPQHASFSGVGLFCFLILAFLVRARWYLIVVLVCIF